MKLRYEKNVNLLNSKKKIGRLKSIGNRLFKILTKNKSEKIRKSKLDLDGYRQREILFKVLSGKENISEERVKNLIITFYGFDPSDLLRDFEILGYIKVYSKGKEKIIKLTEKGKKMGRLFNKLGKTRYSIADLLKKFLY